MKMFIYILNIENEKQLNGNSKKGEKNYVRL